MLDEDAASDEGAETDFKGALWEMTQARSLPLPRYRVVREEGPPHARIFTVEVNVGNQWSAQAEGRTKKVASKRAARTVYERLLAEDGTAGDGPAAPSAPTAEER